MSSKQNGSKYGFTTILIRFDPEMVYKHGKWACQMPCLLSKSI